MSMRRRLGAAVLGAGFIITVATAQEVPIGGAPIGVQPAPASLGPVSPPAPGGFTIWSFLGINQQQREARQAAMARTPLGELRGKIQAPLSKITGGLVPEFPPKIPTELELKDKGIIGKGAMLKQDRALAADRIKAVKELGTADCHYWPEAEEGLIEALRVDRNEWVRLAAAEALGTGCCCTKKTIAALTNAASCSTADDHPAEKSPRVIAAACAALQSCLARVCSNPAVMATADVIPPTPVVDQIEQKKDEGGERKPTDEQPGTSKPGPAGTSVKKPSSKDYYSRVARLSWNQVIVPAKMTLAQGPRIPAELALSRGYDPLSPLDEQDPRSGRPLNLLDVVMGNQTPSSTHQVAMQKLPPAPHIPYAVVQQTPVVPQQMPMTQPVRQASQAMPVQSTRMTTPALTVPTSPGVRPAPVNTPPTPVHKPAAPVMIPASANIPAPVLPPSSTTTTSTPRSIKVCEMLTKNLDPKTCETEVDKLVASDCSTNPALATCLLKYAQEGSEMPVRLACIRALGRCKVNTPVVMTALEKMISDRSVELRVEAALTAHDLKQVK